MRARPLALCGVLVALAVAAWSLVPRVEPADGGAMRAVSTREHDGSGKETLPAHSSAELASSELAARRDVAPGGTPRLHGRVVDEQRVPVAQAVVQVHVASDGGPDAAWSHVASTVADGEGLFDIAHASDAFPAFLGAQEHADPRRPARVGGLTLDRMPEAAVTVVLDERRDALDGAPARPPSVALTGTVRFADGRPAADATVFLHARDEGTRTDANGEFALAWRLPRPDEDAARYASWAAATVLHAAHPDGGLVRDVGFGARLVAALPQAPSPAVLVLPGPHARLVGRLVDDAGRGAADWEVWLVDATWSGGMDTESVAEPAFLRSDADGRFEFVELDPSRTYRIAVRAADETAAFVAGPYEPSADLLEIAVGDSAFARDVAGTAVATDGRPLSGVTLALRTALMDVRGGFSFGMHHHWGEATTDAAGRFRFDRVPRAGADVVAKDSDAQWFEPKAVFLDPEEQGATLTFEPLVPFRPLVADPDDLRASIHVVDAMNERLGIRFGMVHGANSYDIGINREHFPDPIVWVSARGREVMLVGQGDVVLARAPLPPWAGPEAGPLRIPLGGE